MCHLTADSLALADFITRCVMTVHVPPQQVSEEAKRLQAEQGLIAPKKIDSADLDKFEATVEGGASVWNTSGTFEEKDQMKWAKEKLNEVLISTEGDAVFTSIKEVLACLSHHKSLCRY